MLGKLVLWSWRATLLRRAVNFSRGIKLFRGYKSFYLPLGAAGRDYNETFYLPQMFIIRRTDAPAFIQNAATRFANSCWLVQCLKLPCRWKINPGEFMPRLIRVLECNYLSFGWISRAKLIHYFMVKQALQICSIKQASLLHNGRQISFWLFS